MSKFMFTDENNELCTVEIIGDADVTIKGIAALVSEIDTLKTDVKKLITALSMFDSPHQNYIPALDITIGQLIQICKDDIGE